MSRLDRHVALVQNKLTLGRLLTALAWSLLAFGVLVWLYLLAHKLFGVNLPRPWMFFWIGLSASVISAVGYGLFKRPSRHQAAVAIDQKLSLHEKFSTALYIRPSTDPFAAAAVRDAERTADNVSLHNQFPLQFPRAAMFTLAVAVIAFATTWLPAMDLFGVEKNRRIAAEQAQVRKNVEAEVKKALAIIEQAPPTVKENEQIKAIKQELVNLTAKPVKDTTRAKSTAMKALQDVESIKQKIKDTQNFAKAAEMNKAWKQSMMGKPADDSGPVGKAHNHMAKGEFTEAIDELQSAVKNFDKMSEQDKQKAQQQMQNMAQQLQQMANDKQQQKEMEKKLQQLGANPQQAQQMVQKMQQAANGDKKAQQQLQQMANQMMQQMNNGQGPNPQQMQAIQQAMQQAQQQANAQQQAAAMAQAAAQMAQAMQQAQQGQGQQGQAQQGQGQQGNQQNQQQAKAAMQQAIQQMQANAQAAAAAQAGMAGNNGQGGNQGNAGQQGNQNGQAQWGKGNGQWKQGNPQQKGQGMGGPGIGAGGEAPIEEAPFDVVQDVTTGEIHQEGKILASTLVKAASEKGESKIDLSTANGSDYKEATDEIDKDRIPRSAQKAVREYFGDAEGE